MGACLRGGGPGVKPARHYVGAVTDWWWRNIVEPGKLPIFLCFAAFVVTFLATRTITRLIRAGDGPFKDNITSSGIHVHHAVPGIILLVSGAFLAIGVPTQEPWPEIAAVAIGIGTSLVLDEFALILHLQDVYWTNEGRLSVEMVSLATACLGLLLIGVVPFGVDDQGDVELSVRLTTIAVIVVDVGCVIVCILKGKFKLGLFGIFVSPLAYVGAIRLARPTSAWARRRYARTPRRLARATRRAARHDARWKPLADRVSNLIAGRPSEPDPS
jgi:hypothetical protein